MLCYIILDQIIIYESLLYYFIITITSDLFGLDFHVYYIIKGGSYLILFILFLPLKLLIIISGSNTVRFSVILELRT